MDGQGTKCRRNIAENYNSLSRVDERYRQTNDRQTTDGRATAYSEREREEICALSKTVYLLVPNPDINPGNPGMGIGVSHSPNPGLENGPGIAIPI